MNLCQSALIYGAVISGAFRHMIPRSLGSVRG